MNKPIINVDKIVQNNTFKMIFCIVCSAILRAVSVHCFIVPAALAPGGVSGLASILHTANPNFFSVGWTMLIINIPLMLAAFKIIGKKFTAITFIDIIITSIITELFSLLNVPAFPNTDLLFTSICAGVLTGASLFLMFSVGGSTGGTDVMALLMQKKFTSTNVAWLILIVDTAITLSSLLVTNNIIIVFYSFVSIFAGSKVLEVLLNGLSSAVAFYIITDKKNQVAEAIFQNLKRGVTALNAKGVYTDTDKNLLLVVIRRRQVAFFKTVIKTVDPDAFVYSTLAREVIGLGFQSPQVS